jgi:lipooligosaccharide transport system permease protein
MSPMIWSLFDRADVRRPQRMMERSAMVTRRGWPVFFSGLFEPLFYLLSIQIGFGVLVGQVDFGGRQVDYALFVAPALMASAAMNGAIFDSTMNVFYKLRYARLYDTVLATPMSPGDVAMGEIGWAVVRGTFYSVAFAVTMVVLGLVESPWVVLAVPACALVAFAFAAMGMAITSYLRSWADFEFIPAVQIPLFLFSATFFPLSLYGSWAWLVQLSPLYHGVALVRMATFGEASAMALVHLAVLAALAAVGLAVTARRLRTMLLV